MTFSSDNIIRTVAFSGHRRIEPPVQAGLFDEKIVSGEEYRVGIDEKLDAWLEKLITEGYDTFLCGMASGFDLMAGLALCRQIDKGAPARIIALIPHPGQAGRFGRDDREAYEKVLSFAAERYTVCPVYRKECFHMRNDLLVENSTVLLCYYDGSPGGTHYTVKKALKNGHRIINLL